MLPGSVRLEVLETPRWGFVHYVFPGVMAFSVVMSADFWAGLAHAPLSPEPFLAQVVHHSPHQRNLPGCPDLGRALLDWARPRFC